MDYKESEKKIDEELLQAETPEDVAVLYSWANLHGAKYRDFSASRREYRAQMRHRAAESQRESERRAQIEAESAATAMEKEAREAEQVVVFHESAARQAAAAARRGDSEIEEEAGARAAQVAAELARRAAAERIEAARRAEAVAAAEAAARREELEIAEAQASAQRQAQQYHESDQRRVAAAGPQPLVGGQISDPYTMEKPFVRPDRIYHLPVVPQDDMAPARYRQSRERNVIVTQPDPIQEENKPREAASVEPARRATDRPHPLRRATDQPANVPPGYSARRDDAGWFYEEAKPVDEEEEDLEPIAFTPAAPKFAETPMPKYVEPAAPKFVEPEVAKFAEPVAIPVVGPKPLASESRAKREAYAASLGRTRFGHPSKPFNPDSSSDSHPIYESLQEPVRTPERTTPIPAQRVEETESTVPAWIHSPQPQQTPTPAVAKRASQPASPVEDTLQHSRERVAARWFALKGVFDHSAQETNKDAQVQRVEDVRPPLLTVFSLAGGVGKTSLVATLGRALSSTGERVLLTDTTSHGLLPFYFGASELKPGAVRTFTPPAGSSDAPISLVSYEAGQKSGDEAAQEWIDAELTKSSKGMQRVLVDLAPSTAWVAKKLARMNSTLLVPVAPDMNSVISLQGVEKFFAGMVDGEGQAVQPFYVLNQFDASLALHLDVREVMRQQLGDRLLPFAIRRSPSVSEALAEGMTVMDYAPDSAVAGDYMNLVTWLQTQAAPATAPVFKNARWSER